MKIRAGRLRHRLTLQYKVETRTSTGDVAWTWTTDSVVWGAIEPLTGREFVAASQTKNEIPVRVVMRYHATITPSWRIVNDGLAYSILSIANSDSRDFAMELSCSQGVMEEDSIPGSSINALDADGNSFDVGLAVLDADGNSFTVTNSVLDADGNSFTVT